MGACETRCKVLAHHLEDDLQWLLIADMWRTGVPSEFFPTSGAAFLKKYTLYFDSYALRAVPRHSISFQCFETVEVGVDLSEDNRYFDVDGSEKRQPLEESVYPEIENNCENIEVSYGAGFLLKFTHAGKRFEFICHLPRCFPQSFNERIHVAVFEDTNYTLSCTFNRELEITALNFSLTLTKLGEHLTVQ